MGYVDEDWASCAKDRRLYTEIMLKMAGSTISYESRRKEESCPLVQYGDSIYGSLRSLYEAIYLINFLLFS